MKKEIKKGKENKVCLPGIKLWGPASLIVQGLHCNG